MFIKLFDVCELPSTWTNYLGNGKLKGKVW